MSSCSMSSTCVASCAATATTISPAERISRWTTTVQPRARSSRLIVAPMYSCRVFGALLVASSLLACGGGGDKTEADASPQSLELGPLSDSDSAVDAVLEGMAIGSAVGLTMLAVDANADDSVSYSLTSDADSGRRQCHAQRAKGARR
jgi:hypothetical protein